MFGLDIRLPVQFLAHFPGATVTGSASRMDNTFSVEICLTHNSKKVINNFRDFQDRMFFFNELSLVLAEKVKCIHRSIDFLPCLQQQGVYHVKCVSCQRHQPNTKILKSYKIIKFIFIFHYIILIIKKRLACWGSFYLLEADWLKVECS